EFQVTDSRLRLSTRGFEFWDGTEPPVNAEIRFSGRYVSDLRRAGGGTDLVLVRLEPVEIAQINPETGEDRLPVSFSEVPPALTQAVIAVEDQRFYSHYGIDPIGILRAFYTNLRQGAIVQGGSTLT